MPPEYDLVIIGATAAARTAAIEAVNLQARVALILPQMANGQSHPHSDLYPYALAQIAAKSYRNRSPQQPPTIYPWKYALTAIDRIEQQSSPALLAAMGVDTIVGMGEFCRSPQLAFNIDNRSLRARAYTIATGSVSHYPMIPGIQAAGYQTRDRLPSLIDSLPVKLGRAEIPLRWAIIGSEAIGVELAQTLTRLGCQVTLIVETERVLPFENLDFANLIQAQLEADGVCIYLDSAVTNVSHDEVAKLVTIGTEEIAVDEIFIALPDRPLLEQFNLNGVGVDYNDKGISIDNKLQTSNRHIYACGSVCGNVLGGYHSQSLAQYEAKIAVRNALSWRKTKIDYQSYNQLPWAVYTDPPLARVGMTIDTALDRNRRDLIILHQYLKTCPQAILTNTNSGYCQIVVTRSGRILGAEIVGQSALDLIQILAVAIQQKLTIPQLTAFPCLSPSYAEFIDRALREWSEYHRQARQSKFSWLDRLLWWK